MTREQYLSHLKNKEYAPIAYSFYIIQCEKLKLKPFDSLTFIRAVNNYPNNRDIIEQSISFLNVKFNIVTVTDPHGKVLLYL